MMAIHSELTVPLIIVILQLWSIICLGCPSNGVYVHTYIYVYVTMQICHLHGVMYYIEFQLGPDNCF